MMELGKILSCGRDFKDGTIDVGDRFSSSP